MAAALEHQPQIDHGDHNPAYYDPALTAGHVAATQQPTLEANRPTSPSPPREEQQDDNDPEMDVDTRKHMEAPRNAEGRIVCIRPGCETMRFDRKCEWSKHMDKHDRPYKCSDPACVKLKGFTYSGGLLRHQREVHRQHGGPKDELVCPIPYCKRNNGPGFTRKENLNEHIRRVHRQPIPKEPEEPGPKRRERRSLRNRNGGAAADGVADTEGHLEGRDGEVPVDAALMEVATEGPHAGQPAPQANMSGDPHAQDHGEQPSAEASKQLHPYSQAEAIAMHATQAQMGHHEDNPPAMTAEQAQHLAHSHHQHEQVHHPAVPPDFQIAAPGIMEAHQYEVNYLRAEVDRLRREHDEKEERIARLEAALASVQQAVPQNENA